MNIPSVPSMVERSKIAEVLRGWDIDPDDLLRLEMTPRWIKVEIYARNNDGEPYVINNRGVAEVATHEVMIKIG